jgi:UDP-3-O-acyl-N-acetylglucosamine deacetylase
MSGVPIGHVVAYKAGHKLHAKFVKALAKAAKEQVPAEVLQQ